MVLDATVGGPTSNSYVTTDEAAAYFASSLGRDNWPTDMQVQSAALIETTRVLDTYVSWIGKIATQTQALRWPRVNAVDPDGRKVDPTIIPVSIKNIVCDLAYTLVANGGFNTDPNDLSQVRVGPIRVDFNPLYQTSGFPQAIIDALSVWGTYNITSPRSVKQVGLVRT